MTRHSRSPANVSMRYVECGGPFDLPHEAYTGGSRTLQAARAAKAAASTSKGTDDDSWKWPHPLAAASTPEGTDDGSEKWRGTSTSSQPTWQSQNQGGTWTSSQPTSQSQNQGGRWNEHYRAGHMGGRERHGDRGGKNSWYFAGYYKAKAKGEGYVRAYIAKYGDPPSQGGQCFHSRKEEDDAENADPAR